VLNSNPQPGKSIQVYPPVGGTIQGLATDAALTVPNETGVLFIGLDGGSLWVYVNLI
jgi:hypothetical protein